MTNITSSEDLKALVEGFTFEDIGFIRIGVDNSSVEYHKKRRHRDDLYATVNPSTFEAQVYRCNEKSQPEDPPKGTFNLRKPDEVLFMLTHCLNELRVEQAVLDQYKREIGYDPANILPGRGISRY